MSIPEIYSPEGSTRQFLIDRDQVNGLIGWTVGEFNPELGQWEILSGLLQSKAEAKAEARRQVRLAEKSRDC